MTCAHRFCLTIVLFAAVFCGLSACEEPKSSPDADQLRSGKDANDGILRIALVQPVPRLKQVVNLERGEEFCREAKSMGADIVVFPEMYSLGYYTEVDFDDANAVQRWKNMAVTTDGPFVSHFGELAEELDMAILITYLEERRDELRNTATLFDRHGNNIITYSKVHTCAFFKMEGSLTPGDDFYVAELDTRIGLVKTGIMTCYDREFPESARILMLKGAELILTPNACGLDSLRMNQFQIRAWENAVVTAMANYATGQGNGRSCAFNADGEEILIADSNEGVFAAEVDMEEARKIRGRTFWGNAWRRPRKYKLLISTEVNEPWLRKDAFGEPYDRSRP